MACRVVCVSGVSKKVASRSAGLGLGAPAGSYELAGGFGGIGPGLDGVSGFHLEYFDGSANGTAWRRAIYARIVAVWAGFRGGKVPDSAKIVGRGEQVFDPKTQRVISKLYGTLSTGEPGVIETTVVSVEDFLYWYGLQTQTLAAIHKYNAEALIATMPKGRKRKPKPKPTTLAANVAPIFPKQVKG